MGGWVAKLSAQVVCRADDLLVVNDHCTDGDFVNLRRELSLLEGSLHKMAVWEYLEIHTIGLLFGRLVGGGGCFGGFDDLLQSQLADFGLGLKSA